MVHSWMLSRVYRFAAATLCGVCVLGVGACGSTSSNSAGSAATASAADPVASGTTGTGAGTDPADTRIKLAFVAYGLNGYTEAMITAAKQAASAGNASVTVLNANASPSTQYQQVQDLLSQGGYSGILTQPVEGASLLSLIDRAIAQKIKVVNVDQVLGTKLDTGAKQVPGLSGNVAFDPTDLGGKLGQLVVEACQSTHLKECKVGYLYGLKASPLDTAIYAGFTTAIHADPAITVAAQGQDEFSASGGLAATQNMLQSDAGLDVICGSDQGVEGAAQAVSGHKVLLVGYGGSAAAVSAIKSGSWFGTVAQAPAIEGRIGAQELIAAVRHGVDSAAVNPLDSIPDQGLITRSDVARFTPEWAG